MYDIIIVGGGPAGLTAALYALRANKSVLVLEAKSCGGQILNAALIENYPALPNVTGLEFTNNLVKQVTDLGCIIKYEIVLKVEEDLTVTTNLNTYKAKAVIIASGVEKRKLKIDNEEKFLGKGLSYCATCDGNFFKGKTIMVVGGGNSALEDAVYLSKIAYKVYLVHRHSEFTGEAKYIETLKKRDNVEFIYNSNVIKLNGEDKLVSAIIKNEEEEKEIKIDGIFIAIGQEPKNELFSNVVTLDERGYIISEDGVHSNVPKIYVAGDARVKDLRQLTTAVSDGSIAATVAIKEMK